jgi:hypothetical protein
MLISQHIPFDRFETKPPLSSSELQPKHNASEPYTLTLEAQASMTFAPVCIWKPSQPQLGHPKHTGRSTCHKVAIMR